jgi:hypothetical protein
MQYSCAIIYDVSTINCFTVYYCVQTLTTVYYCAMVYKIFTRKCM